MTYIQNLIDLINTVTSYQQQQQQQNQMRSTIYNTFAAAAAAAAVQQQQQQPQFPSVSVSPILSDGVYEPAMRTNSASERRGSMKKDRPTLIKKRQQLFKPAAPSTKLNNKLARLGFNHNSLNLNHVKNSAFICPSKSTSTMSNSSQNNNNQNSEEEEDIQMKVEEHFRKSLGNNYSKFMAECSTQSC